MPQHYVTGPYHYEEDARPCYRVQTGERLAAVVYVHDDDTEEAAQERAERVATVLSQ